MPIEPGFIIPLLVVSFGMGTMIGVSVQVVGSQWKLGPAPRIFLSGSLILVLAGAVALEYGGIRAFPLLLLVYYIGAFPVGTRAAQFVGITAPSENDPPDEFWELIDKVQ